jgi:hypothetical protein
MGPTATTPLPDDRGEGSLFKDPRYLKACITDEQREEFGWLVAGASLEDSDGNTLSNSIRRLLDLLPGRKRREFLGSLRENEHDVSPATAPGN